MGRQDYLATFLRAHAKYRTALDKYLKYVDDFFFTEAGQPRRTLDREKAALLRDLEKDFDEKGLDFRLAARNWIRFCYDR